MACCVWRISRQPAETCLFSLSCSVEVQLSFKAFFFSDGSLTVQDMTLWGLHTMWCCGSSIYVLQQQRQVYRYSVSKSCPMNTYRFSLHYSSGFLHQLSAWGCVVEVKVKVEFSSQTMTLHVTVMDSMTASQVWSLTYHSRRLVACCSTDNESVNTDQVKK